MINYVPAVLSGIDAPHGEQLCKAYVVLEITSCVMSLSPSSDRKAEARRQQVVLASKGPAAAAQRRRTQAELAGLRQRQPKPSSPEPKKQQQYANSDRI